MKSALKMLFAGVFLALLTTMALAADIHEPAKGSPERKAILDAIRPAIEAQMRGAVEFDISSIKSDGKWAIVIANPQRPGGAPIDPEKTAFAGKSDQMDGLTVYALAQFAGGRWNHIADIVGSMDAAYIGWVDSYGVAGPMVGMDQ